MNNNRNLNGLNEKAIKAAIKSGNKDVLLNSLSETDKEVLKSFMNNKEARDKLLSSPEAKALISKLMERG